MREKQYFDVVIVGGGLAGLEVASNITNGDVAIIEAGTADHLLPTTVEEWCIPDKHDKNFWRLSNSNHPNHFSDHFGIRKRWGGRSLCWHGVANDVPSYELQKWDSRYSNWICNPKGGFQKHRENFENHLSLISKEAVSNFRSVQILKSKRGGSRSDGVYTPIDSLPSDVSIYSSCEFTKIDAAGDLYRVSFKHDSSVTNISAKFVVFAASAMGNARIILENFSSKSVVKVRDHIVVGRTVNFKKIGRAVSDGIYYIEKHDIQARYFLEIGTRSPGVRFLDVWSMAADNDAYFARVRMNNGRLLVDFRPNDIEMRYQEIQREIDNQFNELVDWLGIEISDNQNWDAASQTNQMTIESLSAPWHLKQSRCYISPLGMSDHEHGTVPFGTVGKNSELLGVEGIYFAGPSTFPSLGGGNPGLATLCQARVLADHILQKIG